mmetsp:Transcript_122136/g.353114  ORF Transcript_122136/g.353114 Transcript_122136/m.353114 type:complete len:212 (-) Transcript_122136:1077-1712(-)
MVQRIVQQRQGRCRRKSGEVQRVAACSPRQPLQCPYVQCLQLLVPENVRGHTADGNAPAGAQAEDLLVESGLLPRGGKSACCRRSLLRRRSPGGGRRHGPRGGRCHRRHAAPRGDAGHRRGRRRPGVIDVCLAPQSPDADVGVGRMEHDNVAASDCRQHLRRDFQRGAAGDAARAVGLRQAACSAEGDVGARAEQPRRQLSLQVLQHLIQH